MPLIERQVVELHKWLTASEFADVVTISQLTPGPVAINAASFVGARLAGIPGAIIATTGNVLPSCLIITAVAYLYNKYRRNFLFDGVLYGLRPAVVGMISAAGLSLANTSFTASDAASLTLFGMVIDPFAVALFIISFMLLQSKRLSPLWVMLFCGAAGLVGYTVIGIT